MTTRPKIFGLAAALGMSLMLSPSVPPVQAGERIVIGPQFLLPGVVLHVDDPYPRHRRVPPGPPYYYHHGPSPYYYSDYRRPYPLPSGSYYYYNDRPRYYRDRYGDYPPPGSYRERLRERDRRYIPDDDRRYRKPPPRVQEKRYREDTYKEERRSLQERRWSR